MSMPGRGASDEPEERPAPKGVILKMFGVVMIFLGALDLMLFWRAGMPVSWFYVGLLVVGGLFFLVGSLRGRYHTSPGPSEDD